MAKPIKVVPILTGKAAERFDSTAEKTKAKKGSINFSKEIETAKKILAKAKL